MEKTLAKLFDYQKFSGNPALQQVIDSTHSRYARRQLDLADLEFVSAAGSAAHADRQTKQKPWDVYGLSHEE